LRAGESGPVFLECMTYRMREHVGPNEDFSAGYRSAQEAAPWIANDPLRRLGEQLPAETRRRIEAEVEEEIREALAFAEESPWPDAAELQRHLFSEE
ncbi:MAG: thiamine pyrophosphate-dependent enzyme, partial [Planctomycetota bacterium]|nr:thiamine pyrophosphate-dependent enzyme [Planctomycetota bacterium]